MEDMTYGKSDIILAINQRGICRLEVKLSPRKKKKKISYISWTIHESDYDMEINVVQLTKHLSFTKGRNKINYVII